MAYRIFRNNAPDAASDCFADVELAKASAEPYTGRELVVIRDAGSGHFARFDRQLSRWIEGTEDV